MQILVIGLVIIFVTSIRCILRITMGLMTMQSESMVKCSISDRPQWAFLLLGLWLLMRSRSNFIPNITLLLKSVIDMPSW